MSFLNRLGYFLGGFSAGLVILFFCLTENVPSVIMAHKQE